MSAIQRQYEPMMASLLQQNNALRNSIATLIAECKHELNTKHDLLVQLNAENDTIRAMYNKLKQTVHSLDAKIIKITSKNNKLNTIIEQMTFRMKRCKSIFNAILPRK